MPKCNNCMCQKCQRSRRERHRIQKNTENKNRKPSRQELERRQLNQAIKLSNEEHKKEELERKQLEQIIALSNETFKQQELERKQLEHTINISNEKNQSSDDIDSCLQHMISTVITEQPKVITYKHPEQTSHNDFIVVVGRGRTPYRAHLNIPLNPLFNNRNVVYIDASPEVNPDICDQLINVDFTKFGITREQDPECKKSVRIFFDFSSFFCGGIQSIHKIAQQLRRPFEIYTPLSPNENIVPSDIKQIMWQPVYDFILEDGQYPLFDWGTGFVESYGRQNHIAEYVNPNKYIKIICRKRQRR